MSAIWIKKHTIKKLSSVHTNTGQIEKIINWLKAFDENKKSLALTNDKTKIKKKSTKSRKKPIIEENITNDFDDETGENFDEDIEETVNATLDAYKQPKKKNDGPHSSLVVTGKHGIGKTLAVNLIIKDLDYVIKRVDFTQIDSSQKITACAKKLLSTYDILDAFNGFSNKRHVIVIDSLENITTILERKVIEAMIKINSTRWTCPIILTSNSQHNKFINNIKAGSDVVYFNPPTFTDMMLTFCNICKNENVIVDSKETANVIINKCQFDFNRLLFILEDLITNCKNKEITIDQVDKYLNSFKTKDTDVDIYTATRDMFGNYTNINDELEYYEREKTLLPLMIQQNHFRCVNSVINDKKKETSVITKITELISRGDIIENYIYGDQNWHLQKMHGFYACAYPSYEISSNINKNLFKNMYSVPFKSLDFPNDLNRTSIKNINIKNIKNVKKYLPNMDMVDFVRLGNLITKLMENNELDKAKNLLSSYNIPPNIVESILKIDKIKKTKTTITTQMKKNIVKIV